MPTTDPAILKREKRQLGLLLLLALVNGLIFVFLVPPWQHYDEPNHFEHVWLAAHQGWQLKEDSYDASLSRAVVESMVANKFYDDSTSQPDLSQGAQVKIPGYAQLGEPPLYYELAALLLRGVPATASIEMQLYTARLASLLFYLISIVAGWGAAREVVRPGHALRWMIPLTMALLPAYSDVMTAVNNDAAAVAVYCLFCWGSLRLVQRKFSVLNLAWIVLTAALTYFAKNTALTALLVLPVVVLFAILRGRWHWLAWATLLAGIAVCLAVGLCWDDAAYWHRSTPQPGPVRLSSSQAVLGKYALTLDANLRAIPAWAPQLFQPLPIATGQELHGKTTTLGVWMWASQPVKVQMPAIRTPSQSFSQAVMVDQEPKFYALQAILPDDSDRTWVFLSYKLPEEPPVQLFYDGLVLAEGNYPLQEPPSFSTSDGSKGEWGGQPFVNLLRNASAEEAGPRVRAQIDNLGAKLLPDHTRPSLVVTALLDWRGAGYLFQYTAQRLAKTFWAVFGWGHVSLIGAGLYPLLIFLTLLGFGGAVWGALRRWRHLPGGALAVILLAFVLTWGAVITRSVTYLAIPHVYLPVARYAYPAIIPTLMILCLGWLEIASLINATYNRLLLKQQPRPLSAVGANFYFFGLIVLDLWAVISIASYY